MNRSRRRNHKLEPPPAWRARAMLGLFGVFAVMLGARAFELQVLDQEFLNEEGAKRHLRTMEVPAVRGAIRDRRGAPLALSAPTESVWAVPAALLEDPGRLSALAAELDYSTAELRDRLENYHERQFLYLQRQLSPAHAQRVMAVGAPGVFLQREYRRYYPGGESTAQLVGLTDIDGRGQEGIELALDDELDGAAGSRRVIKDRVGRVVEDLAEFTPPDPGGDVRLTVDLRLQALAYRELKAAVLEHQASAGVAVMADPETGEILAMVSFPSFNPNSRESIPTGTLRHRAVTDTFEPGSTFKPLLISRALDAGAFTRDSVIDTEGGRFRVGRLTVRDFRDYGDVDLRRLLTKSSNVGAAKVGLKLGPERLWQVYNDYGFGSISGIRFPGERYGVLRNFARWDDVTTATAAYGYGVSVTALQLIRAYAALADDGQLRDLRLTLAGEDDWQAAPRQVISADAAAKVRDLLGDVVSAEGTAGRAAVPGYRVVGKTGTVRKVAGTGYDAASHQSLFVGMAPADDPALVTLIMVDEPGSGDYYGGLVAAPAFSNIMREALRILRVPPDNPATLTAEAAAEPESKS